MEILPIVTHYFFDANSYLVKTDKGCFLIDSGLAKKQEQLEHELSRAGCRPGDLRLIILTHGHLDHVGNAAHLREVYRSKIAMHIGDANMIASGDMFSGAKGGALIWLMRLLMRVLGIDRFERFVPDVVLEDGQDLSPYGLDARVVHVPGHSDGSIGVLTSGGVFFCGDLLVNVKEASRNTLVYDQADYDASIDKLKSFQIERVFPGHGKPFSFKSLSTTR